MPQVIVIGAGCHGASIAFHLMKRGVRDLLLLDRGGVAGGNTGKSGSIVRQHYSTVPTAELARRALLIFRNWADTIGYGDPGYRETGMLVLGGPAEAADVTANVAMLRGLGVNTELISPEQALEIEPRLDLGATAAICWEPEAGYADPVATAGAFALGAVAAGAQLRLDAEALSIRVENGAVRGVETAAGFIPAEIVVAVTNVWSNRLLAPLGLSVPILPSRHMIAQLRRPPDFGRPHPIIMDFATQSYWRPDGEVYTLVGSIDPSDGEEQADPDDWFEGITQQEIDWLKRAAGERIPAMRHAIPRGGWAGLYDVTPDWQPVLDAAPNVAGLYLACGFSGHGFKLSPIVGDLMAQLIVDGSSPELAPYRYSRFAEGALSQGLYAGVLG